MRQTLTQGDKNKRNLVDNKMIRKIIKRKSFKANTTVISKEYGIILEPNISGSEPGTYSAYPPPKKMFQHGSSFMKTL